MAEDANEAGGFLPSTLLSPPSSHASSATGSLPRARAQPLRSGGPKESSLIRYVDQGILHIQRRFAKREVAEANGGSNFNRANVLGPNVHEKNVVGYKNFKEVAMDVESLIDVLWTSGTRMFHKNCFDHRRRADELAL